MALLRGLQLFHSQVSLIQHDLVAIAYLGQLALQPAQGLLLLLAGISRPA